MSRRIEREKKTVLIMINLYCSQVHNHDDGLCDSCKELTAYALKRTEVCRFGEDKPVCSACPVHCYQRERRDAIRTVMRYSGPRMILYHPRLAIMHLYDKKRNEIFYKKYKTVELK